MKRIFSVIILSALAHVAMTQEAPALGRLRAYLKTTLPGHIDSLQTGLTNRFGTAVHYLYPLYQAVAWDNHFKLQMGKKKYYQQLSAFMAEAADYRGASDLATLGYEAMPEENRKIVEKHALGFGAIQSVDAASFILGKALDKRVLMLDENPAEISGRAMLDGLLGPLYDQGFRYLAVQGLYHQPPGTPAIINSETGVYAIESVEAELLRKALKLGFQLVPYEDSLAERHTENERDSIRAANLWSMLKNNPGARMIVLGEYLSVSKAPVGAQYRPMALQFATQSGIDPLTIEQAELTPTSTFEYGRLFYKLFTDRYVITEPSVLLSGQRLLNPLEQTGFDVVVIHPPTSYTDGRPSWLAGEKDRKLVTINTADANDFFVQAFHSDEIVDEQTAKLVPADQTYYRDSKGNFPLYLRKGNYRIVVRDFNYKPVRITPLTVP